MGRTLWVALAGFACNGGGKEDATDPQDADTDTDTDTDSDTDADADADTDADTDTDTGAARMRLVHVAPTLPPLSLYVDSRPDPVLEGAAPFGGSPWRDVFVGVHTFRVGPSGGQPADVWVTVDADFVADARYSSVLYGSLPNVQFLVFREDFATLNQGEVRYYLFHAGQGVAPFDVLDVTHAATLATGLAFGDAPVDVVLPRANWALGLDLDRDGTADVEFPVPDVGGQVSVPLYFAIDGADAVMLGHSPTGALLAQRVPLPAPPTTGDTGP